jgi:lipoprotein-anchoring transpeptidase ErfK/SrfK
MNKKVLLAAGAIIFLLLVAVAIIRVKRAKPFLRISKEETSSLAGLINQAKMLQGQGNLLEAKKAYQELINQFSNSAEVANWQKKAQEINMKLLLSSSTTPKSILYEIKPGDTLAKIARDFKTTTELIMKSNNLSSDKIIPGRKVKVWDAPFSLLVDKSQNTLLLKAGEEVFKTYIVSTGKDNSTPVGNFKITTKLMNPTWFRAGAVVQPGSPENILGTRWMGFDLPGYGIHGTTDPQSLGRQVTQGCVRMANPDIEELYLIIPLGTEVTIVD